MENVTESKNDTRRHKASIKGRTIYLDDVAVKGMTRYEIKHSARDWNRALLKLELLVDIKDSESD